MPTNSERFQPATVADKVYRQLRGDILNGIFPPGAHLVKQSLAKRYGVSMPPITEACLRLENDGLVESSPQLGSFVMTVFPDKLQDEHIFREAIESQVARVYAARATEWEKQRLVRAAKELDDFEKAADWNDDEDFKRFQGLHCDFHMELARMSGVRLLYLQMRKLWFRRLLLIGNIARTACPNPDEWHVSLAEKLNSGDLVVAENAMRQHLNLNTYQIDPEVLWALYREKRYLEALILESLPGVPLDGVEEAGE